MQRVSTTTRIVSSAKTLVVFKETYSLELMPVLEKWLASPAEVIGGKIYAVLNIPKGKVDFPGMKHCDLIGA